MEVQSPFSSFDGDRAAMAIADRIGKDANVAPGALDLDGAGGDGDIAAWAETVGTEGSNAMTLLMPNGPSKVALSPVPMLNRSKL